MLELTRITHNNETYTVSRAGPDYILECSVPGLRYPDSFAVPVAITGWVREAIPVRPDPVVVPFSRDPLQSIADTLEARAEAGDPLSPAEMIGIAVVLRSLGRMAPSPGCVTVPMRGLVVGAVRPMASHGDPS